MGWAYVALRPAPAGLRRWLRVALIVGLCLVPLATRGPGPAQLTVGILVGYLAIRIVALENRGRRRPRPSLLQLFLALSIPGDILEPGPPPRAGATGALAWSIASGTACLALLLSGADWQLWRHSRFADDLLICVEVGLALTCVHNLVVAIGAAAGRPVVGFQRWPILSASFGEFWGRRWNHLISGSLEHAAFRPLVRAGHPALAVVAAFAWSGAFHLLPVLSYGPPLQMLKPAAMVFGFFMLQAVLVLAERAFRLHVPPVGRLALFLARLRTDVIFVALSPLLLDVFADLATAHGRRL